MASTIRVTADLAGGLNENCDIDSGMKVANHLLRQEQGRRWFVGLRKDWTQAVYYEFPTRQILNLPMDAAQPGSESTIELGDADLRDIEQWVVENARSLVWIHPRFRWLLERPSDAK